MRNKPEIHTLSTPNHINPLVLAITTLASEPSVQKMLERANEYQIQETAEYFIQRAEHFWSLEYKPNDNDILRARVRTTSVSETKFYIDGMVFKVIDVGGQRSDRLFWAPYFSDEVNAILFVVSLASYDQQLQEDRNVNRMMDALVLFETLLRCNRLTCSEIE
ncbi:hypothetical protein HK096_007499 [Nowakowskiella sp. JEL0078]|nr:hypothetical protein HK096_007499 [Nowakowskiella sp. JEL0078]